MSNHTVVLNNATDTFINQYAPSKASQSTTRIAVRSTVGSVCYGFIYFSRPFPLNATIISATLKVYNWDAWTGSNTLTVKKITSAWNQSTTTWNRQPTVTATDAKAVTKTAPAANTEWAFDVKTHMQAVSAGAKWYGWRIESNVAVTHYLNSAQSGSFKPVLEIVYSENPSAPTVLKPSGGGIVGTPKPVLQFDFTDRSGNVSLAAVQVQLNNTDSWTAPIFDTRAIAATVPQVDLSQTFARTATIVTTNASTAITSVDAAFVTADVGATITGTGIPAGATITAVSSGTAATLSAAATASGTITGTITESYAGVASGAAVYWRARTQDGAGNWSAWSKSTSFTYVTHGTLAITQPPAGTITEPTPPIWWTLTGRVQAAYQVFVKDYKGKQIWTSGRIAGSDNEITLPAKVITADDKNYTFVVRTWDYYDRVTTATDRIYEEQSRTVLYNYSATVSPVTSMTTVQDGLKPNVLVGWSRSVVPDYFVVRRNGAVIASNLAPEDYLVSGTTFQYRDYEAVPNRVNQYSVQAVVNKLTSASNPTSSITPKPVGIWLQDPDRAISVQLMDADAGTWDMGEVSTVYSPINSTTSIVVTQSLRGYEGSITGLLVDTGGSTVAQQEASMFSLKSTPGQVYIMTLSDLVIPVVIYNVNVTPSPNREIIRNVSFDFIQVDGLQFDATL